ncbi:MAG TPA: nucleotidyltransferase family protein [Chitinophagaceae bacterium]|jgi:molybdenum cofactor cytidylyltransferase
MLSAVVLAAGLSSRMENKNKLLLPYRGKTILEITLDHLLSAGIDEVVVVTGRDARLVGSLLERLPVCIVHNADFALGLTGSIQKGVQAAKGNGYMICLADMVLITPEEYALIGQEFTLRRELDPACICLPEYRGQKGNPVVFSDRYRAAIAAHRAPEGCRDIVAAHREHIYRVEMPTDHILRDIDTPGDYQALGDS